MAASCYEAAHAVLVVEDEPELRDELVELLQLKGFAAVGAANLAGMHDRLQAGAHRYTVLSDMLLPDGSGSDLVRYLDCGESQPGIERLVLMTGQTDVDQALAQDLSDRAVQILFKPVPFQQLVAALHPTPSS